MKAKKSSRPYYGWLVALCCFVLMFVGYGLTNGPISLYMIPVTEDLGLTRAQFSSVLSLRCGVAALANLTFGWLASRFGLRRLLAVGCGGWAASFALFGLARGYGAFVLGGLCLGVGFSLAATATISAIIGNWFHTHRGLILGLIFAGTGLGSSFFSLFVEGWIYRLGWRNSYFICGGILTLVAMLAICLIRSQPRDKGLTPYGDPPSAPAAPLAKPGVTLRWARRQPVFYMLMTAMFLNGLINNPVYVAAPSLIMDAGYSSDFSARVISLFFLSVAACKVLLGYCYDRLGLKAAMLMALSANIAGILCLLLAQAPWWYIVFALVFGLSLPQETVMMPLLVNTMFGERDSSSFVGICLAMAALGMAVGNPLLNACYDRFGTYQGALILCLILSLALAVLLLAALRKRPSF